MPTLRAQLAVAADRLRRRVDPHALPFETTAEVQPLEGTVGQPRATDAIEFGLAVGDRGYNLFAVGAEGSGRETTVLAYAERAAAERPTPSDWVYVYNFADSDRPNAIRLPPGRGASFAKDMDAFVEAVEREIPRAFESEEYDKRRRDAVAEISPRRSALIDALRLFARERSFNVEISETGVAAIPLVEGKPLMEQEFQQLSVDARRDLDRRDEEIRERATATLRQLRALEKEETDQVRNLEEDVTRFVVAPLFEELRQTYAALPEVMTYLEEVQEDLMEHVEDFRAPVEERESKESSDKRAPALPRRVEVEEEEDRLARYRVNVLVDHGETKGAPVVFERNPTYHNLLGRIEYRTTFGAMETDFEEIRAGALHRANGGFLVLHALDVLRRPFAWDVLKRALLAEEIRMEPPSEEPSPLPAATLLPAPIALDVKVVLIGSPETQRELYEFDEEFRKLFKVKVDFAPEMAWDAAAVTSYAGFVSRCVRNASLRHFDRGAVARVIEYGARLREHQGKVSTQLREIADLVTEANYWAGRAGQSLVRAEDVEHAVHKKRYRSNYVEERIQELILEGTLVVATEGSALGQVNGLSVIDLGDHAFGRPTRITATTALGRGAVRSIERETALSGPIHAKGVLTLSGYLAHRYGQTRPLTVGATITFEQSYDEIEGDSASSAELYALLSALAGVPIDQGVAVTGAVDQSGRVQAIGGVSEKIEGFFAVCNARGLSGTQGVIIPAANVPHLMLDEEVVQAVRAGRFHVWAVHSVDEGIELLTGRAAGVRGADGQFPEGSIHRLVEESLARYAERWRAFAPVTMAGAWAGEEAPPPLVIHAPHDDDD
jgi:lon-related putative ATP-dependent protease